MIDVIMVTGMGNSNAISMLKIMKITEIRKNCDQNGSRAVFSGSNPHSNGDLFCQSSLFFFNVVNIIMTVDNRIDIVAAVVIVIIIYLVFTNFLIGSQIYFLVLDKYCLCISSVD